MASYRQHPSTGKAGYSPSGPSKSNTGSSNRSGISNFFGNLGSSISSFFGLNESPYRQHPSTMREVSFMDEQGKVTSRFILNSEYNKARLGNLSFRKIQDYFGGVGGTLGNFAASFLGVPGVMGQAVGTIAYDVVLEGIKELGLIDRKPGELTANERAQITLFGTKGGRVTSAAIEEALAGFGGDPTIAAGRGSNSGDNIQRTQQTQVVAAPQTADTGQVFSTAEAQLAGQLNAPVIGDEESEKRKRKSAKSKFKIKKTPAPDTTGVQLGTSSIGVQI